MLNWSAVDGAIGYRVFRSTTGSWDDPPLASTSKTTCKNSGLVNGTAYSYKVAGYTRGGNGPLSAEVTATPLAPPPRGDLAAVVRAILTNPEASVSTLTSGKLAEPTLFVVSMLRALNASVTDHPFMSDKTEAMGQKVFYPPTVFSYFSPGYRVRGTTGGTGAPLAGPEFQTLTTVTALERANFVGDLLGGYFGSDVQIDYAPFTGRASDPAALVDYCSLTFMGGRMSLQERAEIINAVRVTPAGHPEERVRSALYLTLTAAQAQVDR